MVKIRLRRMGAKKAPFYRVVVADSRYPRDGRSTTWVPDPAAIRFFRLELSTLGFSRS